MKKILALALSLALMLPMAACGSKEAPAPAPSAPSAPSASAPAAPADDGKVYEMIFATHLAENHPITKALYQFKDQVEAESNGRMLQDVVPNWIKSIMVVIVRVANVLCGAAVLYSGIIWTKSTATKLTPGLQIHYNIWYNAIWVCSILFTVFAVVKLIETVIVLFSGKE